MTLGWHRAWGVNQVALNCTVVRPPLASPVIHWGSSTSLGVQKPPAPPLPLPFQRAGAMARVGVVKCVTTWVGTLHRMRTAVEAAAEELPLEGWGMRWSLKGVNLSLPPLPPATAAAAAAAAAVAVGAGGGTLVILQPLTAKLGLGMVSSSGVTHPPKGRRGRVGR